MKLTVIFVILSCSLLGSLAQPQDITSDVVPAGARFSLPKKWPTKEEFFEMAINLIVGVPATLAFKLVNAYCEAALKQGAKPAETPDMKTMNLELRTSCAVESIPLLEAEKLLNSKLFDKKKPKLVIMVLGWTTTTNSTADIDNLAKAFSCRGDTNFVALDAGKALRTLYSWSAYNTAEVGRFLALALQKLTKSIPIKNIHLIGHSLGAHIVGAAGSHFQQLTGKKLPHITGLDPAKPCFNNGTALMRITHDVADFVDILHSNPHVLGQEEAVGHVDFYAGGWQPVRAGCYDIVCSHLRAISYYLESIFPDNESNFLGTHCFSKPLLVTHSCMGLKFHMAFGIRPQRTVKGMYLADVNANEPYGQDAKDNFVPASEQKCGRCNG